MTIVVGRGPQSGCFDIISGCLKRNRFVFVGLVYCYSSVLTSYPLDG
ncbi:MAG: hypothetical protein JJP05_04740 [cyanobacterium endosymbiont of Rhopalodia gibba]